jgi:hypothetical protein
MKITRTSKASGVTRTRNLPVTEDQMALFQSGGSTIQDIFPQLSPSEREFIKTGITDDEWDAVFSEPYDNFAL